ncbi:MAG: AtzH-like domain-containing protein [Pseudonocardiaceae bacterium]
MIPVPECTGQVVVNRPAVVADVRAAFERYEAALVASDVATLNELFWDRPVSGDASHSADRHSRVRCSEVDGPSGDQYNAPLP